MMESTEKFPDSELLSHSNLLSSLVIELIVIDVKLWSACAPSEKAEIRRVRTV